MEKYNISSDTFNKADITWNDLTQIYDHYENLRDHLEPIATYISERLRQLKQVHSLRVRVKDSEHLIEKIIRKRAKKGSQITIDNYQEIVTDLVGVRVIHLFKEDWLPIHKFIQSTWDLAEQPTANHREGDPPEILKNFEDNGCKLHKHEFGYRSVHYLVKSQPTKQIHIAEVQVRTIFEEGWSEIDHQVRYPYNLDNILLGQFLAILNRLAGSADEMGSYVSLLKSELEIKENSAAKALEEKDALIAELKSQVKNLKIENKQKEEITQTLDSISKVTSKDLLFGISDGLMKERAAEAQRLMASLASRQLDPLFGSHILPQKPNSKNQRQRLDIEKNKESESEGVQEKPKSNVEEDDH